MAVSFERDRLVPEAQLPSWQPLVTSRLAGRFKAIAKLVAGRQAARADEMNLDLIKQGRSALSFKVRVQDKQAYLKLFDLEQPDTAYQREKASLCALRESGLVPRILAFSDGPRLILSEWALDDVGEVFRLEKDPVRFAQQMGQWLAHLDNAAPSEPASGNWFSYLSKLGDQLNLDRVIAAQDMLMEIPLCGRALSRNDAALHNFLVNAEGHLLGFDFDKAQMRPRGWDYILGNIGLVERFPDRLDEVLAAYADGFQSAHRGVLIVEELNLVSRILFCARAFADDARSVVPWQ